MRTFLRGKVTLLFLTLGMLLAFAGVALAADVVVPDGDLVNTGNQAGDATNPINLGPVKGGVALTKQVSFELQCFSNNNHVDNTQGVDIAFLPAGNQGSTVPAGATATATNAHIGAIGGSDPGVPTSWPDDGQNCPATATTVPDNGNSSVTITPPSAEGTYDFVIKYQSSVSPPGSNDPQALQGNGVVSVFYRLTVDHTAPDTVIDTGPSGTVNSNSATFTYHSTEANSTFETRLDNGAWVSNGSATSKTYTGLADAPHTFDVRATDAAGNTDLSPATRNWT